MGRATKHLHSERRLNSASALFQIPNVLIFGLADPAKCGAKTDADAMLRFFAGILKARIAERQLRRCDGKLRIAVEPFQTVRRKEFFRIPIVNLARATNLEGARIEACDALNTALLGENSVPKVFAPMSDASDWTDPGDDNASSAHAVTLFAFSSTYDFMQRNVLLAMLCMKKSPIIL